MAGFELWEQTIGGAVSNTFGQIFTPILILLIFIGTMVRIGLGMENSVIFSVSLIAIMAIFGIGIPTSMVVGAVLIGAILIYIMVKSLWGLN